VTPVNVGGFPAAVSQLSVSEQGDNNCALLADSTVACWGSNHSGALGHTTSNPADIDCSSSYVAPGPCNPTPIVVRDGQNAVISGVTFLGTQRSGGSILKTDGSVWVWGTNYAGQLATGSIGAGNAVPQQVTQIIPSVVATLVDSDSGLFVADSSLSWWGWGRNDLAQLGDGTIGDPLTLPVSLATHKGFARIASHGPIGIALKPEGTVWLWGSNRFGGVGHKPGTAGDVGCPSSPAFCNNVPTELAGLP
jgi:alpha-tubulin suppressor-like RCC1 family protein